MSLLTVSVWQGDEKNAKNAKNDRGYSEVCCGLYLERLRVLSGRCGDLIGARIRNLSHATSFEPCTYEL